MNALQSKYTITVYWIGKHFLGLTLDWNYESGHITLSMPDYIPTTLHRFKHPAKFSPTYAPSEFIAPIYGKKPQYTKEEDNSPILLPLYIKHAQIVVVTLLYYSLSLNNKMIVHLGDISAAQTKGTQKTVEAMTELLKYLAT